MKKIPRHKELTFGEFITDVYNAVGKHRARAVVRLAVKTRQVEFLGRLRYEVS